MGNCATKVSNCMCCMPTVPYKPNIAWPIEVEPNSVQDGLAKGIFSFHVVLHVVSLVMTITANWLSVQAMKPPQELCDPSDLNCFPYPLSDTTIGMGVTSSICQAVALTPIVLSILIDRAGFFDNSLYRTNEIAHALVWLMYSGALVSSFYVLAKTMYRMDSSAFQFQIATTTIMLFAYVFLYSTHAAAKAPGIRRTFVVTLLCALDIVSAILLQTNSWPVAGQTSTVDPTRIVYAKTAAWVCVSCNVGGWFVRWIIRWQMNDKQTPATKLFVEYPLVNTFLLILYAVMFVAECFKFAVLDSFYQLEMVSFGIVNILLAYTFFTMRFIPDLDNAKTEDALTESLDSVAASATKGMPKTFVKGGEVRLRLIP